MKKFVSAVCPGLAASRTLNPNKLEKIRRSVQCVSKATYDRHNAYLTTSTPSLQLFAIALTRTSIEIETQNTLLRTYRCLPRITNHKSQITNLDPPKPCVPRNPRLNSQHPFYPPVQRILCPTTRAFRVFSFSLSNPAPCIFPLIQYHISHQFLTHPSCQTGSIINSSWHFAFM